MSTFRSAEPAGTQKDERGQFQGDRRRRVSDVAIYAAEQAADLLWLHDGGAVFDRHGRQSAPQV